jgi:hypothetical protein
LEPQRSNFLAQVEACLASRPARNMASARRLMTVNRIELSPGKKGRIHVIFNGKRLLTNSRDPEFEACRALRDQGVTGKLVARWEGSAHDAMTLDIERGAGLTTEEGPQVGPHIRKWRPFVKVDAATVNETEASA